MTTPDITSIPAPRVSFVDPNTGLISREWYRWLVNIFTLTGAGRTTDTIADLLVSPDGEATSNARVVALKNEVESLCTIVADQESRLVELLKRVQALDLAPTPIESALPDTLLVKPGTEVMPSIANKEDTDTGLFFPTSGALGITVSGVEAFRIAAGGNISFPGTVSPGSGYSGTKTPPLSVTVVNGIVTGMT